MKDVKQEFILELKVENIVEITPPQLPNINDYNRIKFFRMGDICQIVYKYRKKKKNYAIMLNNFEVCVGSDRIRNMVSNIKNLNRDYEPLYFSLERGAKDLTAKRYHLNLYGINKNKKIHLMTQLDIIGRN